MERSSTCCFTGGRPQHIGFDRDDRIAQEALRRDLKLTIRKAAALGYTDFICGMSRGFDLWAGEAVSDLSAELKIRLHAAIPFRGQTNGWPKEDLTLYENILRACSSTFILSEHHSNDAYHARNRFMVDNSSLVIAWDIGRRRGGTDYTCQYARKNNIMIVNLADAQLSLY